ncbi:BT_3928 family protein [Anditalea andensis]|uniref:DoxX family protein n=1 Tax=Anditalea andensis TaxID=1048983 RepID=A0A074LLV3_9BACT|nr:BT_3928 family protein [Anditalea andensis]KEO74852.1 DoxX family protein [Anditalea andensis]
MAKKIVLLIIRFIVGGLFIFSGLIKINDPIGTSIKLEEYFDVFSYDIAPFFSSLKTISLPLAVFLVVVEVVLGIMLILNYKPKFTTYALAIIILFFTFLTFYSAYFNKVTDCGCFGDAIKLTPWESFYKDVFLVILIAILLIFQNSLKANRKFWATGITVASVVIATSLSIYAIQNLPFIDFRAYKVGVNINTAMIPSTNLEYSYVMKKGGVEFVFDQYPTDDEYEFVEMNLKNPEALPKISDFSVWNEQGDFTDEILSKKRVLILISNISKMNHSNFDQMADLINNLKGTEVLVSMVSASSEDEIRALIDSLKWDVDYYMADATVVKTIIRSNPGLMVLKEGTILGKYHHNNTPNVSKVIDLFTAHGALSTSVSD